MRLVSENTSGRIVHTSHRIDEEADFPACDRCARSTDDAMRLPCPGGGWDLTHLRPWKAEPMDPTAPHRSWQVVAPSKVGKGSTVIITHVSEYDANAIVSGGNGGAR